MQIRTQSQRLYEDILLRIKTALLVNSIVDVTELEGVESVSQIMDVFEKVKAEEKNVYDELVQEKSELQKSLQAMKYKNVQLCKKLDKLY